MGHVQDNAEQCMRRAIGRLRDGEFRYEMDNGQQVAVRIRVNRDAGAATVDFTGTSPQQANNFNAPRAVTVAAVLYVFRTLVAEPIPLNAGCLRPLTIVVPPGSMLDPSPPGAVVAGNVETSQCVVDALYGALRLQAAAQGTMNNFTFGSDRYQYYETIAGGGILGGTVHSSQLPSGRTRWRWRMRTGDLQALLQECLPHLTTKAKEARAMLRYVYHRAHTHTRSRGRRNAIWRARNELTRLKRGPGVPR